MEFFLVFPSLARGDTTGTSIGRASKSFHLILRVIDLLSLSPECGLLRCSSSGSRRHHGLDFRDGRSVAQRTVVIVRGECGPRSFSE